MNVFNLFKQYSEELEGRAGFWASRCKAAYPNTTRYPKFAKFGINMAIYAGTSSNFKDIVEYWWSEVVNYNFLNNTCATYKSCANYLQVRTSILQNKLMFFVHFKFCIKIFSSLYVQKLQNLVALSKGVTDFFQRLDSRHFYLFAYIAKSESYIFETVNFYFFYFSFFKFKQNLSKRKTIQAGTKLQ